MEEITINGVSTKQLEEALNVREKAVDGLKEKLESDNEQERKVAEGFMVRLAVNQLLCSPRMDVLIEIMMERTKEKQKKRQAEIGEAVETAAPQPGVVS